MRFKLKLRAVIVFVWLFVFFLVGVALAQTGTKTSVLYRWVDEQGRVRYTDNLNEIPERFRNSAVKGSFVPTEATTKPRGEEPAKPTGQVDLTEDNYYREDNFYHIVGKVRNGFSQPVTQVKVKVTFYDEEDRFLMVETTLVDPMVLSPGQDGKFHLMVKVNPKIDSYKIEVLGRP
ncbi:MAG: DUF4124 domain-containing protein [Myxococcales bacterium]|nr:DUF4124 domain-containing protein [Myxococcales bacterium]